MCSSYKSKQQQQQHYVLEPRMNSIKQAKIASLKSPCNSSLSPPISPKIKSPIPPAVKRGNNPNEPNSKKPKKSTSVGVGVGVGVAASYDSALIVEAPGSIATARRQQAAIIQEQRKLRIAHYGRRTTKSANFEAKLSGFDSLANPNISQEQKRCSFITPNSDPIYVAYHDEEWGVPVHDDQLLFELLVLTASQVGSDWTSVLKKRQSLREAFSGFEAEVIAKFTEKKITSISSRYGIDISQVRGFVDNSHRILQVKKEFGSFEKYLWGFVNKKAINKEYRSRQKIPVKTSKSESISKDMVKKGFRFVGPTTIHLFMQAAGLTNDHLIYCSRHLQCNAR
ncbi:putative DNA-3-methyladenine glycosylase [Melia azedarach]|uniref:DNA-3-methyladenine glycosylase n=1 Tax=Melia azedarach TaxID=155640 RepID=A0ACC1WUD8_MELAZ|nr:putative DNA-3-methyladenine glycosylase [Melia azedarach]